MKITAIIVVYNQRCSDSVTCRNLLAMGANAPDVIIFENSTSDFGNREYCRENGWIYLGGEGNLGLSKAYNSAIDYLSGQGYNDWICLFDDDTDVTGAYFTALEAAAEKGGQLCVPYIYSGGRLLSPCRITPSHKAIPFASEQETAAYQGRDISAINSAMAMSMELFRDYRYDENIFLDGIDHTHMQKMAEKQIALSLLDVRLYHSFSGDEQPAKSSAVTRFRLFSHDYAYIFRNARHRYWYLVGKRALRLTAQYKTLGFLKILVQNAP